ncbi:MAG: HlyC/CorC family transporter [Candidatus Rokubacteria bacterium]|nr:HlyC/CorC family transporter [Candidatus Rokubacteria bacterium]
METIWLELVLIAVAILANGFFAGSEIALVSSRISRLAQLRQEATTGAAKAMNLKERPETFLATIQIAITAVGTLASAVGGATAIEALTPWLAGLGLPGAKEWAEPVALGIVVLLITYVSLVIGELAPKAVALRNPERIACLVAPAIFWLSRISSSMVRALTASTNAVLRVLGQGTAQASPFISEEEVRYLVREGAAKGIFEKLEEELVHNVFEFADTTVREIMTPRPHIQGLDIATPAEEVLQRAVAIGHSRIPVYRDSVEQAVGIIVIKDLLRAAAQGAPFSLPDLLRPPLFIPETARISFLLREFQRYHQNLALVVDEYGGVVGLVTLEDVLEEIVGEIREEGEAGAPPFAHRLPDGSYVLDGFAPIRDVRAQLALPVAESSDYHTVAGFLIHSLGVIPMPGASVAGGGYRWTVVDMEGPRITKVKVEREAR